MTACLALDVTAVEDVRVFKVCVGGLVVGELRFIGDPGAKTPYVSAWLRRSSDEQLTYLKGGRMSGTAAARHLLRAAGYDLLPNTRDRVKMRKRPARA